MIEPWQEELFREQGFLIVNDVFSADEIAELQSVFDGWVDESREHAEAYGETLDGRHRFDPDSDHSAAHPSLRRVASPTEISSGYYQAACHSRMTGIAARLIGPGLRFHHSKINSKLPGTRTEVKWHQDFLFTPHSNDDLVTALLMVSDVTADNGPLQVIPGSHRGPLYSHWQDGRFRGAIDERHLAEQRQSPVSCQGTAGSVCFMHTRLLHASAANQSPRPRTLFITVYAAEDAWPLAGNPLPSVHERRIVAGEESGQVRCVSNSFALPEMPKGASFFEQQAGDRAG
ncbi:phytanoyl-CoA dioxygenase family protein [Tatumella terrea]|uniref:Phytanoyl-CoA dioxygenase family protein n=1 Tax=Tatumella terrea TaxID=419007 RepID=A0ABW1W146_9GAMM